MLDDIRSALEAKDGTVVYGDARSLLGKNIFNYTVFAREKTRINSRQTGSTAYYAFALVRENYIPDGEVEAYVQALREIGLQGPETDVEYDYITVGKTGVLVEAAVFSMYRPRKGSA